MRIQNRNASTGRINVDTKPCIKRFLRCVAEHERKPLNHFIIDAALEKAKEIYKKEIATSNSISYRDNFDSTPVPNKAVVKEIPA